MPSKLARLFSPRRATRDGDRAFGLRLAAGLLASEDPTHAITLACRLARRVPGCTVALVAVRRPDGAVDYLAAEGAPANLTRALSERQDLVQSLDGLPRWVSLGDDPFQPGAPVLRRFDLQWALAIPFTASLGGGDACRCVALLAGPGSDIQPHHPLIRDARLIWLAVRDRLAAAAVAAETVAAGQASAAGDAGAPAPWPTGPGAWETAPAALCLVQPGAVVAANAAARTLLAEHVGRGGDHWQPWLLGAVQRLEQSDAVSEVLTASQSRGRRLSVTLGAAPAGPAQPRLVAVAAASAEELDSAAHEATMRTLGHEVRTPLTAMQTSLDLVLRGRAGEVSADQERFLQNARRNLERLNRLLGDLLDAKRGEAGHLAIRTETVDLGDRLQGDLEMFALSCREKQIELDASGVPEHFRACVDADKVQQMLHNVVSNAVKYTPSGGLIRVWLQDRAEAAPGVGAQLARRFRLPLDAFTVVVEDSGLGMSEEFLETLFQPFSREDRPETRRLPGAGLGLHITRGLVEAHGGEIRLSSRPGEGTTVWLVLPREPGSGAVLEAGRKLAALRDAATAAGVPSQTVCLDVREALARAQPWEAEAAGAQVRRVLRDLADRSRHEATAGLVRALGDPCWTLAPGLWAGLALDPERLEPAWQVATAAPESSPLLAGRGWIQLDEPSRDPRPHPAGTPA